MYETNSTFFIRSKAIATRYLQTTVIIDDRAYFDTPVTGNNPISVANAGGIIKVLDASEASDEDDYDVVPMGTEPLTTPEPDPATESHQLNARSVINSFADKNIICSVIKPDRNLDLPALIPKLMSSADIIVFDWDLNGDEGKQALELLEYVSEVSLQAPSQLRLFAIYTGDQAILPITTTVKTTLEARLDRRATTENDGFTIIFDSVRIVFFCKPGTKILEELTHDPVVPFAELAERVTTEFAKMTVGLVSNLAMTSLALIRENSSSILKRFNQRLDAPYLTHRSLQIVPGDAEDFITALVAEELKAILEEKTVGIQVGFPSIEDSLRSFNIDNFQLKDATCTIPIDNLIGLLTEGSKNWWDDNSVNKPTNLPGKNKLHKFLTKMFAAPNMEAKEILDDQFAVLATNRSFYENSIKFLTLGTVLRRNNNKTPITDVQTNTENEQPSYDYILCLQPSCDSVRLTEARSFPFIKLSLTTGEDSRFNIVIYESSSKTYLHLLSSAKAYDLMLVPFVHSENSDRIVVSATDHHVVDNNGLRYEWLGELRAEHAMSIAQIVANDMSRVGVDQAEWLRRSSGS